MNKQKLPNYLLNAKFPGNYSKKKSSIAFVAGKSGGHIIPCLTIADQYKKTSDDSTILFFTTSLALDRTIINQSSIVDTHVPLYIHQLPRRLWDIPSFIWNLGADIVTSFSMLKDQKIEKVISTGGITAFPVCLAAFILGLPIDLYELNAVPGNAIKLLSWCATTVYYCFDDAKQNLPTHKSNFAQYPIRYASTDIIDQKNARLQLGLNPDKTTITILGGSQGSEGVNKIVQMFIQQYGNGSQSVQFIHQTGTAHLTKLKEFYHDQHISCHLFDYKQSLALEYAAADIIIARSGAGTIFESQFFGRPCILIPLETIENNHQLDNAYAIARQYPELFTVMRQKDIENDLRYLIEVIEKVKNHDKTI